MNEFLKEYQTLFNVIIFGVILWWSLKHIGNHYMKLSNDKQKLTERLEERLNDLDKSFESMNKMFEGIPYLDSDGNELGRDVERRHDQEDYNRREESIRLSHDRSLRNLYEDYKSLHLTFIYQGIWVIGSFLFVIVLMMVDF